MLAKTTIKLVLSISFTSYSFNFQTPFLSVKMFSNPALKSHPVGIFLQVVKN